MLLDFSVPLSCSSLVLKLHFSPKYTVYMPLKRALIEKFKSDLNSPKEKERWRNRWTGQNAILSVKKDKLETKVQVII